MIKYLRDSNCIDFSKLLLMRAKQLEITSEECLILLYLLQLKESGIRSITPVIVSKYVSFSNKQLDSILSSLMVKKLIENKNGFIELLSLETVLLSKERKVEEIKQDIISVFEAEFGRALSPYEITTLREWVSDDSFNEETILMALKEAVKSNVVSLRYIEAILVNWKKNGVSRRYVDNQQESKVPVSNYDWLNQ